MVLGTVEVTPGRGAGSSASLGKGRSGQGDQSSLLPAINCPHQCRVPRGSRFSDEGPEYCIHFNS